MEDNLRQLWFKIFVFIFLTVVYSHAALNIALRKPATQSSTASSRTGSQFLASKAVDGNLNQNSYQCIHTAFETKQTEAWWQVDLQQCSEIKDVKIYYRSNSPGTRRLNMFEMYMHDTESDWRTGTPCYNDTDEELPPTILTVNCSGNAQYVTIHNTHYASQDAQYGPFLELCEVQVNGCIVGKYGEICENDCSSSCNNSRCDVDTGYCLEGCTSNWFGDNCTDDCNCEMEGCHRINGTCFIPGCKTGWQGDNCNNPCEENTFGPDCNAKCHCLHGTCDLFNGECDKPGCKAGYLGDNCSTECADNTFGLNCNTMCHCKTGGCNNVNGICSIPNGCKDGWRGESCDTQCEFGNFGPNCLKNCYCLNGTCDPQNGICQGQGCIQGWKGRSCNESVFRVVSPDESNSGLITGVIAAVTVVIVLIISCINVGVCYMRHRNGQSQNEKEQTRSNETNVGANEDSATERTDAVVPHGIQHYSDDEKYEDLTTDRTGAAVYDGIDHYSDAYEVPIEQSKKGANDDSARTRTEVSDGIQHQRDDVKYEDLTNDRKGAAVYDGILHNSNDEKYENLTNERAGAGVYDGIQHYSDAYELPGEQLKQVNKDEALDSRDKPKTNQVFRKTKL